MNRTAAMAPITRFIQQRRDHFTLPNLLRSLGLPLLGIALFLLFWQVSAQHIKTSLGQFPGPAQVWEQAGNLWQEHVQEQQRAQKFITMQEARNARILKDNPDAKVMIRPYVGYPTFIDQIGTSLVTVTAGFLLASLIAIPLGILMGMNRGINAALNPLVQVFKPVSPLAWLPLVTMVVSAVYVSDDPLFAKSFLNSMITVTLCSLWPTLINTSVGVGSVSEDLNNVSRVLRLRWFTHVRRDRAALRHPHDLHRPARIPRHRLDGPDRRGNAGPEPGPGQIRLGRIPERQQPVPEPHHGRRHRHRPDRLFAGPGDAGFAEAGGMGQEPVRRKT